MARAVIVNKTFLSAGTADILHILTGHGVKLNALLSMQREILARIERLEKKVAGGYVDEGKENQYDDILGLFPLISLKDLESFEKKLKLEKERCQMVVS
jgi:hypothetical protein